MADEIMTFDDLALSFGQHLLLDLILPIKRWSLVAFWLAA